MRNAILAAVLICALAVAGIGGTLAGWSDTEESVGNQIVTGSLDLKVNGNDDLPWGEGIGAVVEIEQMQPDDWWHSQVVVRNDGQSVEPNGEVDPDFLFIMFKNIKCDNEDPIHIEGSYEDFWYTSPITEVMKLEPELVTEYGGVLGQVDIWGPNWVEGEDGPSNPDGAHRDAMGQVGDDCCLSSHLMVEIWYDGYFIWEGFIGQLYENQLYLGICEPCGADHYIDLYFMLPQQYDAGWPEEYWPEKFAGWETNGFMVDKIGFDIMFELLDHMPDLD